MKPLVYLAGPISVDPLFHARNAITFCREVERKSGVVFIVPQESVLSQMICPRTHAEWLARDKEVIRRCDALFRLPGKSPGADEEVEFAKQIGIPVIRNIDSLNNFSSTWKPKS